MPADRLTLLLDALEPARLTRIMDIGANPIHAPPYKTLMKRGACEVWGFEPQPEAHAALLARKSDREHYYPHAIGDGDPATLYICKSEGFTSILPPDTATLDHLDRWHKAMTVTKELQVETKRLDDLTDLPSPDLLKIDVQGAECMIFEHAAKTLQDTVAIISEVAFVPLYRGQPLYHDQAKLLETYGFGLSKFMFLKQKTLGSPLMKRLDWRQYQNQAIDGDAVFTRHLFDPSERSDEQLKHLAICADAVFDSPDLTLKCLAHLQDRGAVNAAQAEAYVAQLPFQKPT